MTAGGFLFEMLLMLPQHSRWYTAFSVPKPSSYPDALDILVRLCADIVRGGPFHFGRYVLDSFTLLQYLIDEIMGEKPRVPAPVDSSLHSPAPLIIALCFFLCLRLYRGVPKENDEIGQVLPYLSPLQSQVQAALYPSIVHPPYYPTCVQISMPNPLFSSCTLAYDCFGAREAARSFICWYCPYVAVLRFKCQDSRIE